MVLLPRGLISEPLLYSTARPAARSCVELIHRLKTLYLRNGIGNHYQCFALV